MCGEYIYDEWCPVRARISLRGVIAPIVVDKLILMVLCIGERTAVGKVSLE